MLVSTWHLAKCIPYFTHSLGMFSLSRFKRLNVICPQPLTNKTQIGSSMNLIEKTELNFLIHVFQNSFVQVCDQNIKLDFVMNIW